MSDDRFIVWSKERVVGQIFGVFWWYAFFWCWPVRFSWRYRGGIRGVGWIREDIVRCVWDGWWDWLGLNQRPSAYKAETLTD